MAPIRNAQRLSHFSSQIPRGKRLFNKVHAGVEDAVVDDGVVGVAGHVEHFEIRPFLKEAFG